MRLCELGQAERGEVRVAELEHARPKREAVPVLADVAEADERQQEPALGVICRRGVCVCSGAAPLVERPGRVAPSDVGDDTGEGILGSPAGRLRGDGGSVEAGGDPIEYCGHRPAARRVEEHGGVLPGLTGGHGVAGR